MFAKLLRQSLSGKILASVLFISSAVTLFTTAAQLLFDYRQDMNSVEQTLQQIQRSYIGTIAHSLWDINDEQLKTEVEGLLRLPDVKYLRISDTYKSILVLGEKPLGRILSRDFDIVFASPQGKKKLGVMTVIVSLEGILSKLYGRVAVVFFSQLLKTFLVSTLILISIRRLLIQPLGSISDYLEKLEFTAPRGNLILKRSEKSNDELDVLVSKINQMKQGLSAAYNELHILNDSLEEKVKDRTLELERTQKVALENAHAAGMAEIATGVLHNVGNILNGVNIGAENIRGLVARFDFDGFKMANDLLDQNRGNLGGFFTNDPRGLQLIIFFQKLQEAFVFDSEALTKEAKDLLHKIQLIKDVVNLQQNHAKGVNFKEEISIHEIVEDAILMQIYALTRNEVKIVKKLSKTKVTLAQKSKLIHILINLFKNATESMTSNQSRGKILTIETGNEDSDGVFVRISDTGNGVLKEDIDKIFSHGFTTKKSGHGFGLHYCANAMAEMGGSISVRSEGLGTGTAFTLHFKSAVISKKVS